MHLVGLVLLGHQGQGLFEVSSLPLGIAIGDAWQALVRNATAEIASGWAGTAQTYAEVTVVMLASLFTALMVFKALPYITSSILFFAKFCACAAVLSLSLRFIEHSALVKALRPFFN